MTKMFVVYIWERILRFNRFNNLKFENCYFHINLCFPQIVFTQITSDNLTSFLVEEACQCAKVNDAEIFDEVQFGLCFSEGIVANDHYIKSFTENGLSTKNFLYEKGNEERIIFQKKLIERFVYECDEYYHKIQTSKKAILNSIKWEFETKFGYTPEELIVLIEKKLFESPNEAIFYSTLSMAWYSLDEYDKAYENIKKAVEIDPNDIATLMLYASICEIEGNFKEAFNSYEMLITQFGIKEIYAFLFSAERKLKESLQN